MSFSRPSRFRGLTAGLVSGLIASLALCLPVTAQAGPWKIRAGVSAQVAGSCLAIVNLISEADRMTGPERPDYKELAWTWVDHIVEGDADFAQAAMEATEAAVIRYDDLARAGDAEARLAILTSDMAACQNDVLASQDSEAPEAPEAEAAEAAGDPLPAGPDPRP